MVATAILASEQLGSAVGDGLSVAAYAPKFLGYYPYSTWNPGCAAGV